MIPTSIVATRPEIPALPPALRVVPSWLDHPEDPRSDEWRQNWVDWAENLKDFRAWATQKAATDKHYRHGQLDACANDVAYFLAVYGWIFEPRDTDLGPPNWYPWALFPHQVIALRQCQQAWASKKPRSDVVWEKSRDMGATWLAMGDCLHQWLFAPSFTAGVASYKEDAVDDGTPDSMFFKLRGMLGVLEYGESPGVPTWMRPEGYIPMIHGRRLKLNHPSKMCVIKGEATTMRTGTGFRNTRRINDEGAKHEMFAETLASLRATTNHMQSLSSAYTQYGTDFQEYAASARAAEDALDRGEPDTVLGPRYFRMEHWMHPFHDAAWLAAEEAGYSSREAFAREVLIDYRAGNDKWIYAQEAEQVPRVNEGDDPDHGLLISMDPGKEDIFAIVFSNVWGDPFRPRVRWVDSYETNRKPVEYFGHLLTGIPPQEGDVCFGHYGFGDKEERIMAWMLKDWLNGRHVTIVMDPAGAQMTLASMSGPIKVREKNFPALLDEFVFDLRDRYHREHPDSPMPSSLNIQWKHLFSSNRYDPRRVNLRAVLADSEVTNNAGGDRLVECWMNARYQERTREATSDPKHVHDDYYHVTAASEYLASHLKVRGNPALMDSSGRKQQRPRSAQRERKKAA